jgi:DNA-binding NarL/FixJ family response regulator
MRIIIADDHAIVRKGLKLILEEEFSIVEFDEAGSGDEIINFIREKNYDIAILDIQMPGKDVIDTLRTIKSIRPNLPVLIFSMNPEKAFAIRMLKAGALGYINKDCEQSELIQAIKKVSSGRGYISGALSEILASSLREGADKPMHDKLSDREFQVLCMIAGGQTLDEISENLFLSKNTVSNHRNSVMKKLDLRNNSEITIYAIKNDLVS